MAYHRPLDNLLDIRRAVPRGGLDDGTLPLIGLVHPEHELPPWTDSIPLRVRLAGPVLDGQPCVDRDVGLVADLRLDHSAPFLGDDLGLPLGPRRSAFLIVDLRGRRLFPLDVERACGLGGGLVEVGTEGERP